MSHDDMQAGFDELRVYANSWYDLRETRKALSNRVGGANREHLRIPPDVVDPLIASVEQAEKTWEKALVRCYRRVVPVEIREWQAASRGISDRHVAMLLGVLGHPVLALPQHWELGVDGQDARVLVDDPPFLRSLAQLRAYCGVAGAKGIPKGASQAELLAAGNRRIGPVLYLMAEACVKQPNSSGVYGNQPWKPQIDSDPTVRTASSDEVSSGAVTSSDPADVLTATTPATPGRTYRDTFEVARSHYELADCVKHPEKCPDAHKAAKAKRVVKRQILSDLYDAGVASLEHA